MIGNPSAVVLAVIGLGAGGWIGWQLAGLEPHDKAPASLDDLVACLSPHHSDGDNIRCQGGPSSRLYAIDAREMPGSCRQGRDCTPGDPYAARDDLAGLMRGQTVERRPVDADDREPGFQSADFYGRPYVQCFAGLVDLSCAMVRAGHAVERYGKLDCGKAG